MNFIKAAYIKFKQYIKKKRFIKLKGKTYDSKASRLLDMSIEYGVLVTLPYTPSTEMELRGIGKTTELVRAALKYDATIIVGNRVHADYIEDFVGSLGLKVDVRAPYGRSSVRGLRLPNDKFLVDEGVQPEIVKELMLRHKLLGGFMRFTN